MDQAREADAGDMARLGEHALEVPDRFLRFGEMLRQETAAVPLGEEAVESPLALRESADIEEIHYQQIARFRAFDADRAG
jgi:hypothetical protein